VEHTVILQPLFVTVIFLELELLKLFQKIFVSPIPTAYLPCTKSEWHSISHCAHTTRYILKRARSNWTLTIPCRLAVLAGKISKLQFDH
jgi:hypothetical protein